MSFTQNTTPAPTGVAALEFICLIIFLSSCKPSLALRSNPGLLGLGPSKEATGGARK